VANANTGIVYTNFTTNNASVLFYWAGGPTNVIVQCSAMANGKPVTAQAAFNVLRPEVDWEATITGSIAVDTNYFNGIDGFTSQIWLHFGNSLNGAEGVVSGIYFTPTNLNLNGFAASDDLFCVQLIDSEDVEHCRTNGFSVHRNGNGLDTTYPFEDFGDNLDRKTLADDAPATTCQNIEYQVSDSDHFRMFLMFQPVGGIPVPLRLIEWNWSASANINPNYQWTLTSSNVTITANNQDTTSFPTWTTNIVNFAFVTNMICQ
jgi:hypothetical protein